MQLMQAFTIWSTWWANVILTSTADSAEQRGHYHRPCAHTHTRTHMRTYARIYMFEQVDACHVLALADDELATAEGRTAVATPVWTQSSFAWFCQGWMNGLDYLRGTR